MPDYADHVAACRAQIADDTEARQIAEVTWRDLPVKLATERGHTVREDGVTHLRWTCVHCQRAVLCVDANIYGGAITEDCPRKEN